MGLGGISIWQLLIILAIVVMLFGTKRLRGIGGDLGEALKGFRKSMSNDDNASETKSEDIEGDASTESKVETNTDTSDK